MRRHGDIEPLRSGGNSVQKKRRGRNASPFRVYLVSDLILVLLVLGAMIPFIYGTVLEVNERMRENLRSAVTRSLDGLDSLLSMMENALFTGNTDAINALSHIRNAAAPRDYYTIRRAKQFLHTMAGANPTLKEVLITYSQSDFVLTCEGCFDSRASFDRYFCDPSFYDEIFAQRNGLSFFLPARRLTYSSPQRTDEVFSYSFNLKNLGRAQVCLLIDIDSYVGQEMLQTVSEAGYAVLADYSGNIIKEIGTSPAEKGSLPTLSDARQFVTVQYASASGRLTLSARMPKMLPANTLARFIPLLLTCLAAAVAMGTVYSALIAGHHARPVKRLIAQLHATYQQVELSANRINAMQKVTDKLKLENEQFTDRLEAFRLSRYENAVTRLFTTGNISEEDLYCIYDNFGSLPQEFVVAYGKIHMPSVDMEYQDEVSMLSLEQLRENLPEGCLVYMNAPNAVGVLMDVGTDRDAVRRSVALAGVDWSFSRTYEGVGFVSVALEEARMVHQWNDKERQDVSIQSYMRIYQCMIAGNDGQAKEQVNSIFRAATAENIHHLYNGVRFIIYLASHEYECCSVTPAFDSRTPIVALNNALNEAIERFCHEINERKKSKNENRKRMVLDYIQQNYTDSNLYAGAIAEHAGISEKYLYSFIKEQTGCSVSEYLQNLRMEKAVEILCNEDTPIKEICGLVGFNSENSFYKAFKRTFGVTPTQYRASGKKKNRSEG